MLKPEWAQWNLWHHWISFMNLRIPWRALVAHAKSCPHSLLCFLAVLILELLAGIYLIYHINIPPLPINCYVDSLLFSSEIFVCQLISFKDQISLVTKFGEFLKFYLYKYFLILCFVLSSRSVCVDFYRYSVETSSMCFGRASSLHLLHFWHAFWYI